MLPYVRNGKTITIFLDGAPHTINSTHLNWKKIIKVLPVATSDEMRVLLDVKDIIANGVYMIYMLDNSMYCVYSKSNENIFVANPISKIQDFSTRGPTITPLAVLDADHVGTYLTVKDILVDYAHRFI